MKFIHGYMQVPKSWLPTLRRQAELEAELNEELREVMRKELARLEAEHPARTETT